MRLTKDQQRALLRVYQRDTTVAPSYRAFRRAAHYGYDCIMVYWHGMWLGIEKDGYTHS
jgi:hypothetical protein